MNEQPVKPEMNETAKKWWNLQYAWKEALHAVNTSYSGTYDITQAVVDPYDWRGDRRVAEGEEFVLADAWLDAAQERVNTARDLTAQMKEAVAAGWQIEFDAYQKLQYAYLDEIDRIKREEREARDAAEREAKLATFKVGDLVAYYNSYNYWEIVARTEEGALLARNNGGKRVNRRIDNSTLLGLHNVGAVETCGYDYAGLSRLTAEVAA
jgi:hypothetical protein